MVQKCSGQAKQRVGPKLMNCCKPEPMGTQGYGKMLKRIQVLEDGSPSKGGKKLEDWWTKEKNHKKRVSEASEQV